MTPGLIITEALYFFGAGAILFTGLILKSAALWGLGIYLLYSGPGKTYLVWNLIFLGTSVISLFYLIKVILIIFLRNDIVDWSQLMLPVTGIGSIYFEIIYRISLKKKNRIASILLMVLLIQSVGTYILGGFWLKIDIILGFLSLAITVIISFRKAYYKLTDILS